MAGAWRPSPPSSAEVKERVEKNIDSLLELSLLFKGEFHFTFCRFILESKSKHPRVSHIKWSIQIYVAWSLCIALVPKTSSWYCTFWVPEGIGPVYINMNVATDSGNNVPLMCVSTNYCYNISLCGNFLRSCVIQAWHLSQLFHHAQYQASILNFTSFLRRQNVTSSCYWYWVWPKVLGRIHWHCYSLRVD